MSTFKVGDWVRVFNRTSGCYDSVAKITKSSLLTAKDERFSIDGSLFYNQRSGKFIPWTPKEGEWCWYKQQYFVKVIMCENDEVTFSSLDGNYINDWDYLCWFEPFIGELPSFLKDK